MRRLTPLIVVTVLAVAQLAPSAVAAPGGAAPRQEDRHSCLSKTAGLTHNMTDRNVCPPDFAASLGAARSIVEEYGAPQNALEAKLLADAAAGHLDAFSPLGAAMVAGGVADTKTLQRYEQKAAALAEELRCSDEVPGSSHEEVETIFNFLHRRILYGGYDLAYSDPRRVLDEGRFNCISASVLFNYLAGKCGFACHGLEMPGHAMCRVALSDGPLDIETTCPNWFRVAGTPRVPSPDVFGTLRAPNGSTRYALSTDTSPPQMKSFDRTHAREVTPLQMAAMIYYNRGVDLLATKQFAGAAACNAKALRLDPQNAPARGNLLATINNWSIELGNTGHYAEAIDLLRRGLTIDPTYAALSQNFVHIHHQWADHLCQTGQFEKALAVLSRAAAEMPDRDYLRQAEAKVRERWAKAVSANSPSNATSHIPCVNTAGRVD